jgi:hypothetical protein
MNESVLNSSATSIAFRKKKIVEVKMSRLRCSRWMPKKIRSLLGRVLILVSPVNEMLLTFFIVEKLGLLLGEIRKTSLWGDRS